jgi:hypothetical protein
MIPQKSEDSASFAHAEIEIQGPAKILIRLFNGRVLELDPRPYRFPSDKSVGQFLIDILSRAMHETMILANLRPTTVKPRADATNGGR